MIDTTPNLFDAYARHTDPGTSHAAATQINEEDLPSHLAGLVLDALRRAPDGLTNHELVEVTGVSWNTITPRVRPLVNKGLVVDSGIRRKGPSGKKCIVWRVA